MRHLQSAAWEHKKQQILLAIRSVAMTNRCVYKSKTPEPFGRGFSI